jgi:hypothetical protein
MQNWRELEFQFGADLHPYIFVPRYVTANNPDFPDTNDKEGKECSYCLKTIRSGTNTGTKWNVSVLGFQILFIKKHWHFKVGFEILTAVSMKMAVFWVVAPCSLVEVYQITWSYNPEDSHLHWHFISVAK